MRVRNTENWKKKIVPGGGGVCKWASARERHWVPVPVPAPEPAPEPARTRGYG
jgi:hypothetical protein